MNPEEIKEVAEKAHEKGEKTIGLTMAIIAAFLAAATLLGHRAHTEEVKLQTKVNDGWGFYQAKHGRAHTYGLEAEKEVVAGNKELAARYFKISRDEECGVPAEHNCTSPVLKESPILQQFLRDASAGKTAEHAEDEEKGEHSEAKKQESETGSHEKSAKPHKDGAVDIQEHTRDLEKETDVASNQSNFFDIAELFLEVSIVLCSVALLAEMKLLWQISLLTTIAGIAVTLWGLLGVH